LRALDAEQQAEARTRLAVSDDVHRAVLVAQSHELLALRDRGAINDQTYLALQLELDKRGVARA
jgi:hypothetical protein